MADESEPLDRAAARLRKRFERVTHRLRDGLTSPSRDAGG